MSFVQNSVESERSCEFSKLGDRLMKIKSPTVSKGVVASSSEIWNANLAQSLTLGTLTNLRSIIFGGSNWKFSKFSYPVAILKPDIQMGIFLISNLLFLIFEWKKISKLVGYTKTIYFQTGKNTVSWNFYLVLLILLIFKVVYWVSQTSLWLKSGNK